MDEPARRTRRLWLVFFSEAATAPWWARFLKPGYRHVSAISWFAHEARWVFVDPTSRGIVIELYEAEDADGRLGQLVRDSTLVLRVKSQDGITSMPILSAWCVGCIKALLGMPCRASSPWRLARYLLRNGAEIVETPIAHDGKHPQAAQRRPAGEAPARAGIGAR